MQNNALCGVNTEQDAERKRRGQQRLLFLVLRLCLKAVGCLKTYCISHGSPKKQNQLDGVCVCVELLNSGGMQAERYCRGRHWNGGGLVKQGK